MEMRLVEELEELLVNEDFKICHVDYINNIFRIIFKKGVHRVCKDFKDLETETILDSRWKDVWLENIVADIRNWFETVENTKGEIEIMSEDIYNELIDIIERLRKSLPEVEYSYNIQEAIDHLEDLTNDYNIIKG